MRPPLVLTGGPAVGKSTMAGLLARTVARAAVIEVDDVRQLIVTGTAAPWEGREGLAQQRLGVQNACGLARRFHESGFDVVLTDVLTPVTLAMYRQLLTGCLIIRLHVSEQEMQRRAATRPLYLSDAEFTELHAQDRYATPLADHHVDTTNLTLEDQLAAVTALWREVP